jgi:hypothetical protein
MSSSSLSETLQHGIGNPDPPTFAHAAAITMSQPRAAHPSPRSTPRASSRTHEAVTRAATCHCPLHGKPGFARCTAVHTCLRTPPGRRARDVAPGDLLPSVDPPLGSDRSRDGSDRAVTVVPPTLCWPSMAHLRPHPAFSRAASRRQHPPPRNPESRTHNVATELTTNPVRNLCAPSNRPLSNRLALTRARWGPLQRAVHVKRRRPRQGVMARTPSVAAGYVVACDRFGVAAPTTAEQEKLKPWAVAVTSGRQTKARPGRPSHLHPSTRLRACGLSTHVKARRRWAQASRRQGWTACSHRRAKAPPGGARPPHPGCSCDRRVTRSLTHHFKSWETN